jgi:hypothetical protein
MTNNARSFILTIVGLIAIIAAHEYFSHHAPQSVHAEKKISFANPVVSFSEAPLLEHPVIAEGIHDLGQLYAAMNRFPSLYRKFDPTTAQLTRLKYPLFAYSSYRVGNRVLWTKERIVIAAGTEVWMDAAGHLIEARCGNMLLAGDDDPDSLPYDSLASYTPTLPAIVPSVVSETPPPTTLTPPDLVPPTAGPPSQAPPAYPVPPVYPPCCASFVPPNKPPVSVPEPSSAVLLLIGFLGIVLLKRAGGWL